jgi:phage-related protein
MSTPIEHKDDAHQLTGDGRVRLYEITPLTGGVIRIKADNDVLWQGHTWEGIGVFLEQIDRNSDDQVSRPKLSIANPNAIFSPLVQAGLLEDATVTEYTVLKQHIDADVDIYTRRMWKVRFTPSMNRRVITLELRDQSDGVFFQLPGRMYIPPDFPTVSLQ